MKEDLTNEVADVIRLSLPVKSKGYHIQDNHCHDKELKIRLCYKSAQLHAYLTLWKFGLDIIESEDRQERLLTIFSGFSLTMESCMLIHSCCSLVRNAIPPSLSFSI